MYLGRFVPPISQPRLSPNFALVQCTTDGAWTHLFPIFMNYGLYKSQSPTSGPYVTITRTPSAWLLLRPVPRCRQRREEKFGVGAVDAQERFAEGVENTKLKFWSTRATCSFVRIITEISRAINNSLSSFRLPAICIWVCVCVYMRIRYQVAVYIIILRFWTWNDRFSGFFRQRNAIFIISVCLLHILSYNIYNSFAYSTERIE